MNILIAGGAGYIGSVLVPKLQERNYHITVVDLLWFGNHLPQNVDIIKKNIFDLQEGDLKSFDQVIFLAGLSNDPMAEFSPSKNFIYNAAAPAYLSYVAKRAGIKRFIYASSCSVYGYTVNELYDENSPTVCDYPYGISKLQGEIATLKMTGENFSVISLRQGTLCGYSPRMRLDLVVNAMFKSAIKDQTIVINNPSIWRPILFIEDCINAYIRAIEADENISGTFNIASNNYTIGELGDLVKKYCEENNKFLNIQLHINHIKDFRNYKVSIEKAKNILSFNPFNTIEHAIKNLFNNLSKFDDFSNPIYYNISVFKNLREKI
jgi:nucleoside-diphosphate-sugar epimerase